MQEAEGFKVSAIVPARNEEATVGAVVQELLAQTWPGGQALIDEVIVADNGSCDATARMAAAAGARVIRVDKAGYGQACWAGTLASTGDVLIFVDADGSANSVEASILLSCVQHGADLAIGMRTAPQPGSMSAAQRWGNALACGLMRLLWGMPARDLGPFRAITRRAFDQLQMRDRSFGWTVEMQLRAFRLGLKVIETPVSWRVRQGGVSKISGTLTGVLGAGLGILGMIARLWVRDALRPPKPDLQLSSSSCVAHRDRRLGAASGTQSDILLTTETKEIP